MAAHAPHGDSAGVPRNAEPFRSDPPPGPDAAEGSRSSIYLGFTCGALLLAGVAFFLIAEDVVSGDPLVRLDTFIADWLHVHGALPLTYFLLAVTHLHSTAAILIYTAVLAVILHRRGERDWLITLGLAVPLGMAFNTVLKFAYQRARPIFDAPLLTLTSYSFPSGHTAGAVLFYGFLVAFLISRVVADLRTRVMMVCGAVIIIGLVGFSRMYLGVHFFSDVLGAASAGAAWLSLCLITVHQLKQRRPARTPAKA
jgi:membrane-associated phospholipid phosphatase